MKPYYEQNSAALLQQCNLIKKYLKEQRFSEAEAEICRLMGLYPESALPHNLYGIFWEKKGEHAKAMNHFRAAMALDATCKACRYNLELFGSSNSRRQAAYSDKDLGFFHQAAEKIPFWSRTA